MPESTNPMAPGSETSEGQRTKWIQIFSGVLVAVGAALGALQEQLPGSAWVGVAAMIVGGLVTLFTHLGYIKSRAVIKSTMIASGAIPPTSVTQPPK